MEVPAQMKKRRKHYGLDDDDLEIVRQVAIKEVEYSREKFRMILDQRVRQLVEEMGDRVEHARAQCMEVTAECLTTTSMIKQELDAKL